MSTVQVRILRAGRTDIYGAPLVPGSVATVDRDYAVSLVSSGFASWVNRADAGDGSPVPPRVLYQSGISFWMPPGDGGANGLSFTGTRGVFTLSAAAPLQYSVSLLRNCYCYLPAGAGGLVTGGLYWCQMSDDTNGEIFADTFSGIGQPAFISSPTPLPNLTAGRITQTLSEVTAVTVTVPGGSLGPNGILSSIFGARYTNSATTKFARVKLNGQSFGYASGTTTNTVSDFESLLQNQGTEQKHSRVSGNVGRLHAGATALTSSDSGLTVADTTVDTYVTLTLNVVATTDSVIGYMRNVVVHYGA